MNYASVIVTYNRKELLAEAVKSLLAQSERPQAIIIIDNASTDGTEAYLQTNGLLASPVRYVRKAMNEGGAAGFCYGLQEALKEPVDWISLSDDDAWFAADFFEQIACQAANHPEVSAFCGSVRAGGRLQLDHRRRVDSRLTLKQSPLAAADYDLPVADVDTFSFVGCVARADVLRRAGLPDKAFFIRFDDTEYSLRIGKLTPILLVGAARIDHRTTPESADHYARDWREFYGLRNECLIILQYSSHPVLAKLYVIGHLAYKCFGTLTRGRYRGNRGYRLRVIADAARMVLQRKKGKHPRYLPRG
ncbi:MAG: glycosyltransferase [Sporolactobacillus sp.]